MTEQRSDLEVVAQALEGAAAQLTVATEAGLDGTELKVARKALETVRQAVRAVRKLEVGE